MASHLRGPITTLALQKGAFKMRDNCEHIVTRELPATNCFRCGICCERYQPPVTLEEIRIIAARLGMTEKRFISKYTRRVSIKEGFILRQAEGSCIFLSFDEEDKTAECTIYPVRPNACREWAASLSRLECQEGLARLGLERTR